MNIVNKTNKIIKKPLKKIILDEFTRENGKFFYSFEITPKNGLQIDFTKLKKLPLFVDATFIFNHNLKYEHISRSPAFEITRKITCSQTVNSLTCYNLEDHHIDEILKIENLVNLTILRGDKVYEAQKYKFATDLVREVRKKNSNITIMVAGYPEKHPESISFEHDLEYLKEKVEAGADIILTQLTFSSKSFIAFVKSCRKNGIEIPIIPGLYIPRSLNELNLILKITNIKIPYEFYAELEKLSCNEQEFQNYSLRYILKFIEEIQSTPEYIPGFHFYTMNDLSMLRKLIEIVNFTELVE